jgi:hypothetical protein
MTAEFYFFLFDLLKDIMPHASKTSSEKNLLRRRYQMVFQIQNPTKEEIEYSLWLEENHPELLNDRELWVLQNFCEVVE